jgi:hypothetical protein
MAFLQSGGYRPGLTAGTVYRFAVEDEAGDQVDPVALGRALHSTREALAFFKLPSLNNGL